ncbi:MAG: DinB family protein [Anaerolineae bacterium]|nr:DinB family protein [Anaerolineae bacterium]MDW8172169.1 DinB family protein [Anaerolineae bacterium]
MSRTQIEALQDQLAQARAHLLDALSRVGDRVDAQIYSEGAQWTVRQLAIHLMIADQGHNNMIFAAARGENIIPEDYDLERFNRRSVEKAAEVSLEQAIERMSESRRALLEWLADKDDSVLAHEGRHASLHMMTIAQMMGVMVGHERGHADDILRFLGAAS